MTFEEWLERFPGPRRKKGNGYDVRCNSHEDKTPSLSISQGDGRTLLHCHSGCPVETIVANAGATMKDLFDEPIGGTAVGRPRPRLVPTPRKLTEEEQQQLAIDKAAHQEALRIGATGITDFEKYMEFMTTPNPELWAAMTSRFVHPTEHIGEDRFK